MARPSPRNRAPRRRAARREVPRARARTAPSATARRRPRREQWEQRRARRRAVARRAPPCSPASASSTCSGRRPYLRPSWKCDGEPILGVSCPRRAQVRSAPEPERSALAGSAALISAAQAHRTALDAAVRLAAEGEPCDESMPSLRLTAVRRNAIERRWIPAHEQALAALELSLDELEREDGARVRRLVTGSDGPSRL